MKKALSVALLCVFALSFAASALVTSSQAEEPCIGLKVECRLDRSTGEYFWWVCCTVEEKGKSGDLKYSNCYLSTLSCEY